MIQKIIEKETGLINMAQSDTPEVPLAARKKVVVDVADMKVLCGVNAVLMTLALGSCIGLAVHDAETRTGGMIHFMLPLSSKGPEKAQVNPYMYGDTGIPLLFRKMYEAGARKENMRVVMAGGASVLRGISSDIGSQNITITRKLLWKNQVIIAAEDVGGTLPRTLYLDVEYGKTWFTNNGNKFEL